MFYKLRSRYGGMDTSMLKRMYADVQLEAHAIKEALAKRVRTGAIREDYNNDSKRTIPNFCRKFPDFFKLKIIVCQNDKPTIQCESS